jgi:uncharacterized protein YbjT (DUF2867 family)
MRVLVTEGTGFLGSHLCARLVEDGHEVTVLRRATSGLAGLAGCRVRYAAVEDVTDAASVNLAVAGQQFVVNVAAAGRVRRDCSRSSAMPS